MHLLLQTYTVAVDHAFDCGTERKATDAIEICGETNRRSFKGRSLIYGWYMAGISKYCDVMLWSLAPDDTEVGKTYTIEFEHLNESGATEFHSHRGVPVVLYFDGSKVFLHARAQVCLMYVL